MMLHDVEMNSSLLVEHSKTFEMKMDSSLKHVEKIQITMELEYKINPVRLNHVHSKLFCQVLHAPLAHITSL
jgi:hypothetical protein